MIASIIGVRVSSEKLLYSISKAALIMFTKCIAYELGPLGIRANVILPSITPTKFRKNDFYVSEHLTSTKRIEHKREFIDEAQYGELSALLGAAEYRLTSKQ